MRKTKYYGVNDIENSTHGDSVYMHAYFIWRSMMQRCYAKYQYHTYDGCTVCESWFTFSNFADWFIPRYKEGLEIDKDILKRGNKVYCPEYCSLVPRRINQLLCRNYKSRGEFPLGVRVSKEKRKKPFRSYIIIDKKNTYLGDYDTPEEAFLAYKEAKEKHIKDVATTAFENGEIDNRVYEALMKYEVQITD